MSAKLLQFPRMSSGPGRSLTPMRMPIRSLLAATTLSCGALPAVAPTQAFCVENVERAMQAEANTTYLLWIFALKTYCVGLSAIVRCVIARSDRRTLRRVLFGLRPMRSPGLPHTPLRMSARASVYAAESNGPYHAAGSGFDDCRATDRSRLNGHSWKAAWP